MVTGPGLTPAQRRPPVSPDPRIADTVGIALNSTAADVGTLNPDVGTLDPDVGTLDPDVGTLDARRPTSVVDGRAPALHAEKDHHQLAFGASHDL